MNSISIQKEHGITLAKRRTAEDLLMDEGPYAQMLNDLVMAAKKFDASDIHIEPNEMGVSLRLRVDGNLKLYKHVELQHRESLTLEVKRIFSLAIGVSGRPQDGRASLPGKRLDLRVSLLPTHFGEKVVMRLLNLDARFDLEHLGFLSQEQEVLRKALRFEDGVVVISGPTGSGKTKTLYTLLKTLDPKRLNIVTLEDPIEYRIEGLNQVQVTSKMSFADALRSVLRQDPDVILVGEIRDSETAKLCFQAAETGHLVFTTLHANGALEVIERLRGLKVDELVLKSNLRLSIAQRLEQKVCKQCFRTPEAYIADWYQQQVQDSAENLRAANSIGCEHCVQGSHGRVPVLEWAEFGRENEAKVVQSLQAARIQRAVRGEIDCEEVWRANV